MSFFEITGRRRLSGRLTVHGAKNSVLPILAACILSPGECIIRNCPDLSDVSATLAILRELGCKVQREEDTVTVDASGVGMLLPLRAFSSVYGKSADYLLAVAVLCFSFATVICWGYYGECCLAYFTKAKWALALYRTLFSASVLLGAWLASSLIWTATDVSLGLMTGMNVLALLVLAPVLRQREKSASPEKEFLRVH